MLLSFILYLLKICNFIDDKKTSSTQTKIDYNDVYKKTPTRYLHHLEGDENETYKESESEIEIEDENFHPIEF